MKVTHREEKSVPNITAIWPLLALRKDNKQEDEGKQQKEYTRNT